MDEIFSLRKFSFVILRRWRMVVIVTLIFTCLGGLYKIVPGFIDFKDEIKSNELKKAYQDHFWFISSINQV